MTGRIAGTRARTIASGVFAVLISLFLLAPVAIIIIVSFDATQNFTFPPASYSTIWYERFLGSPLWRSAIWNSLQVALLSTLIATTIGFFAALALVRGRFRGKDFVYTLILMPMIVPTVIFAVALYLALALVGLGGGMLAISIGHAVLTLPLVTLILASNIKSIDQGQEMAAFSLGAGWWYTLRRVTIPSARLPLVSAALFAFLFSFDELVVALFLSGVKTETLPVRIWNSLIYSFDPTVTAVSAFFIIVTGLVLALDGFLKWRAGRGAR